MKIFISYRRDDSGGYAGRLFDHLTAHFGTGQIFMDVDTIQPGEDFREAIENAVVSCDVVLVMIGRQWLSITDAQGKRRLDNPRDFVRAEVASALATSKVRVIPILVHGAGMPSANDLPDDLKDLAWRNATELSDSRFQYDANKLIGAIEKIEPKPVEKSQIEAARKINAAKLGAVFLAIMVLGLLFWMVGSGMINGSKPPIPTNVPVSTITNILTPSTSIVIQATVTNTMSPNLAATTAMMTAPTVITTEIANIPSYNGDLSIRKPTLNEIRANMLSIWDANILNVQDIRSPDIVHYEGEAEVGREYLWTWHWCATTKDILQSNRLKMIVHFYVDGEPLPNSDSGPIFAYDYDLITTATPCSYWSTVVGGWHKNKKYELTTTYTFTENIDDGSTIYPSGDYGHVLTITVR